MTRYVVICDPWQGEPYVDSGHASWAAAQAAARRAREAFRRHHGDEAYGYRWVACRMRPGQSAAEALEAALR